VKKASLLLRAALCALPLALGSVPVHAGVVWGTSVTNLSRGTVPGDFGPPEFYGGSFPGSFPVVLSNAEATAAVLGPPDTNFLSLPGTTPTPGAAFAGAYVEIDFPINFDHNNDLLIRELGASAESAHLFIWFAGGGNLQLNITRNGTDDIVVDLAPYAGLVSTFGPFARVGVGGLDLLGASQGFDLDAVGIVVPEPGILSLLGLGLLALVAARRKLAA